MNCWHCGALLFDPSFNKKSFRATCERCDHDLHCCKNCIFYKPGRANDCSIPGTEWVSDREKNNFCEEFSPLGKYLETKSVDAKKRFEDLFT